MHLAEIEAKLTAPGAMFELGEEDVLGERMLVFKQRARSLVDLLRVANDFGENEYLVFYEGERARRITFAEHGRLVASTAARMRDEYGITKGDRVAIFAANCPEWIIGFWAAISLGAIAVGLNGWWTGAEARFAIDDVEPKLLLADAKRYARFEEKTPAVPTLVFEREALALAKGDAPLPSAAIAEDDPAIILYTSGTTGRPKGALHSHRNVIAYVMSNGFHGARMALAHPLAPRSDGAPPLPNCVLITSPLFHVSGLHSGAVSCLAGGVKTVWPMGRFDPHAALRLIDREKITGWGYTATLLHRTVVAAAETKGDCDLSSLRVLGGGGSPIAPHLQTRARETFPSARSTLGVGYGLTESGALATLNPSDELARLPTSVGRPLPTVQIEIRDAAGRALPEGDEGEVCIRSPLVMIGYWRRPEATREILAPGRWLRTGDIGTMRDGRLYLTSRRRDLILRGGENVYPHEIEQRLEEHPDVREAAVIGIPHDELGEEVKAIVVPREGTDLDARALAAWARATLAYFKVPAHWEIRRELLPRTATGKIMKHAIDAPALGLIAEE